MRWALAALLLCAACRAKPPVPILNYHSVGDHPDEYFVTAGQFSAQLDWLVQHEVKTLPLREATTPHPRAVVLTFDDGKEDALTRVLPALRSRRMHAAFFVPTALIGTPGFLTWDGVRALDRAGMEIGSHGAHHTRLADLDGAALDEELLASRRKLESELGHDVGLLAYPYNSVRSRVIEAAKKAGYRLAVSGVAHGSRDPLNLLRTTITGNTTLEQFAQIVSDQRAAEERH